jgi:hypothetical protein
MTRMTVPVIALTAGLALFTALPAASAEQQEWDQAAATELAKQLAEATGSIRQAARSGERPGPGSGLRNAHLRALDDLRRLENMINRLARQLEDGAGREATYPTFRRVRALRDDLARTARRFIREPAPTKLQQIDRAFDRLDLFYAAKDSAARAS